MRCVAVLLAVSAACALSAQEALFRPQQTTVGQEPVSLGTTSAGLLTVRAELEGKPCVLLVDTGASHSTWDRDWVRRNLPETPLRPIAVEGETNVREALAVFPVTRLKVGGSEFGRFLGVAVPLAHLSRSVGAEVAGILGMNVMGQAPFRLSVKDARLEWRAGQTPPPGAVRLPVGQDQGDNCFYLKAQSGTGSKPFAVLLDSGANVTVMPQGQWPEEGGAADLSATDVNAADQARAFRKGRRGELLLGDFRATITPVVQSGGPALLGADTLKGFDLFLDGKARQAWAAPHPKAPEGTP